MQTSLRAKLITSFLAVIIICGLIANLVAVRLIGSGIIGQAQDRVRTDLNSARHIYRDEIKRIKTLLDLSAQRFFIKDAISQNDIETLRQQLGQIRERESLDILTLTDRDGQVIVRSRNPSVVGDNQANDELVSSVLSAGEAVAGTVIVPREELMREGEDLADQAYMKLIPTPKTKPRPETEQTSAMCIKAAAPVFGHEGSMLGVLYCGNLLNRNYEIVDEIREIVYQGVKYKGKDIGTATIFQGDLRISTNVELGDANRAIGTRVSEEVRRQVLVKGLPWIHRAFVVNNWYIAAYEPIRGFKGDIIGILYVGILEEKFMDMRNRAIATFSGITLGGMAIALIISNVLAKGVLQPVKRLVFASRQLAKGNLGYEVRLKSKDEIGKLGETFNLMASSLRERDERLKEYAQQQIMKSERLATLGQLAAGVAHEINNPLGAVLMYAHLSLEEMEAEDSRRQNLENVVSEVTRCRDIVKGLLDFARQTEPKVEELDVNEILERTLSLVGSQALFQNIRIIKQLCPSLPKAPMDGNQIQQVFTNIMLNAAEAMEGGGDMTVTTRKTPDCDHIEIEFADTGCGVAAEHLEQLFEPFFTTKEVGQGTGLGLAVSYGIIAKHNGTIDVRSKPEEGSTFTVRLPLKRDKI